MKPKGLLPVQKTKNDKKEQNMFEDTFRAETIVGESIKSYNPAQVVNYALFGDKNHLDYEINDYLVFGKESKKLLPGSVIIGKAKMHLGIVNVDAKFFIHASLNEGKVVKVPISQLKALFPEGYTIRIK